MRGFDVTASAPKSVSVLFALGDDATRAAVLDAHDAAVAAMVDWIEDHAHTRYRIGGQVATFDAEGIVAACFRQHTSRALDPQLHTHVVIANRVVADDGRWLALDARTIKCDQRTLSALYHAGLRAELTRSLGVAWARAGQRHRRDGRRPRRRAGRVLVPHQGGGGAHRGQARALRRDLRARPPTPRERWRLEREAVTDSRPAKAHGVDACVAARRVGRSGRPPSATTPSASIGAAVSEPTTGRAHGRRDTGARSSTGPSRRWPRRSRRGGRPSWSGSWPRPCPPTVAIDRRDPGAVAATSWPSEVDRRAPGRHLPARPRRRGRCAATAGPSPSPPSTGP